MILTGHMLPPIDIDYILLTPAIAEEFMAANIGNRNEKLIKQGGMIRDMLGGGWIQTGEAIKFDTNGRMIDGQNRCRAVIRSGVSIPVLVIRGLDPESQGVMDSGTPRTSRDALHFAGFNNGKEINAVANIHRAWKLGVLPHAGSILAGQNRMTNRETVEYVTSNPQVEAAAIAAKSMYARGLRLPIGAIGTAIIALSAIDADECETFFRRIIDMEMSGKGDPIATLVKRVNDIKLLGGTHRLYESTSLFFLFRTWNAVRTGEALNKLVAGSQESGWTPIPEPK